MGIKVYTNWVVSVSKFICHYLIIPQMDQDPSRTIVLEGNVVFLKAWRITPIMALYPHAIGAQMHEINRPEWCMVGMFYSLESKWH
jgi:hypothetical protein